MHLALLVLRTCLPKTLPILKPLFNEYTLCTELWDGSAGLAGTLHPLLDCTLAIWIVHTSSHQFIPVHTSSYQVTQKQRDLPDIFIPGKDCRLGWLGGSSIADKYDGGLAAFSDRAWSEVGPLLGLVAISSGQLVKSSLPHLHLVVLFWNGIYPAGVYWLYVDCQRRLTFRDGVWLVWLAQAGYAIDYITFWKTLGKKYTE